MKSLILPKKNDRLHAELDGLYRLKPSELAERWRALYGGDMPPRLRRPLIIQALAYRLQEKALGGLKPATRRLLETAAGRSAKLRSARQPKWSVHTGAVLIREWHGSKYQVTVLKDGFTFKGRHFESLSKIAAKSLAHIGRGHCSSD